MTETRQERQLKERKARRKAELDAMRRCEVPGCKRRGTWSVNAVLLCGWHLRRARWRAAQVAARSPFGVFTPLSLNRPAILAMAGTSKEQGETTS